jgi:hypothetical protein
MYSHQCVSPSRIRVNTISVECAPQHDLLSIAPLPVRLHPPGKGFVGDADVAGGLILQHDRIFVCSRVPSPNSPVWGAKRRARIEVSSPATRTLPSVEALLESEPNHRDHSKPFEISSWHEDRRRYSA